MNGSALPDLPDALQAMQSLALDLRWTWSHEADALWSHLDAELWERTQNPWAVLQLVAPARLRALAADPAFVAELDEVEGRRRAYLERPGWFHAVHGRAALGSVAYFSLEFGLGAALPLYAGGLGVLAGDFLKTASDLAMPVVGVGLLYQEGYFRQMLDPEGIQHEAYPYNEPAMLPIEPALVDGAWLRVSIDLPGRPLVLRVWQAQVGRTRLYLLDSNHLLNSPADRGITGKLYGGDAELRLIQEAVLGVAGWRALEALGCAVEVCHINEGHAALAIIERACSLADRHGLDFDQALWASRPGNIFTTHTPEPSGFDRFDPALVARYLPALVPALPRLGLTLERALALGRADPGDDSAPFNTAYLAMRGSGASFAVSRVHGQVSRRIFQPLFPRWPEAEVPIGFVTNGVHAPSWDSAEADRVWTDACGKERWRTFEETGSSQIGSISDEDIWRLRGLARQKLVADVRQRLGRQFRRRALSDTAAAVAEMVFDPNILTLGFARRFTDYKRPALLLRDPERLGRLLLDPRRPAQIVVAGKAHPSDDAGKAMIRQWLSFARDPRFRGRVAFLEDYDIATAQDLVQGVDVWLNTPRRPSEACGTSGMKILVNGGLNCSVLDGWWAEAYRPDVGWAVQGREGDADTDGADADALYRVIEDEIAPEFYARDAGGLPRAWLARIRRSMTELTPVYSSARMAQEYLSKAYLPAAATVRRRLADDAAGARALSGWAERLRRTWAGLHIGASAFSATEDGWSVSAPVLLGELACDDVRVEAYAEAVGPAAEAVRLEPAAAIPGTAQGYIFTGTIRGKRPAADYTIRVIPAGGDAILPVEAPLIAWER